jgi:hypothetical protein
MTASAGQSNLFTSTLTDNVDLASSQWAMRYDVLEGAPGGAGATLLLPKTTIGGFQTWTKTGTDAANYPLYRSMTTIAGASPIYPYVATIGAQTASLQSVAHQTVDRAGLLQAFAATNVAIPAVNLPTLSATDPYLPATWQITGGFVVSNAATTISRSGSLTGAGRVTATVNLTATVTGTLNTMPVPFARVEFWAYDAVSNTYRFLSSATTPSVVDNVANRVYTYTAGYTPGAFASYNNPYVDPGANPAVVATSIIAIGVNATNDAVRSPAVVTISIAR